MEQLDKYNQALEEIYKYFGFKEDWVVFPIDDRRAFYWYIDDNEYEVTYADNKDFNPEAEECIYYKNEILTHRFYKQSIYRGLEYTMIMVDTHTDGNKFLAIYDNSKMIKPIN